MRTINTIFVVGKGRSGSTLLDTLLGQVPGVFSMGELRYLWAWGVLGGFRCGCGEPVVECSVWGAVIERVGLEVPEARSARWASLITDRVLSWPRVPGTLMAARSGRQGDALQQFVRLYDATYAAVTEVTGAHLLVDSSKWPAHPALLGLSSVVSPTSAHLVRDPRGVASSYRRGKPTDGDQPTMPRFGALHTAMSWTLRNTTAELVPRAARGAGHVRVRYEDLVANPAEVLERLLATAGVAAADLAFLRGGQVELAATHTVGGNPGRFRTGTIALRPDDRWRRDLPSRDRTIIEVLTAPLARRYDYHREGQ